MWFELLVFAAALGGGVTAGVAGFGIGSLLTPAFALQMDARLAVAAVSVPHAVGTAFRLWMLGGRFDPKVLRSFGLTSALGGLAGALLQGRAPTQALMMLFGLLLIFTALAELTGLSRRMKFSGAMAPVAGAASGVLGGLVGNQGSIRSAALLGTNLSKAAFVGTATAVALMVDAARLPIYLWRDRDQLADVAGWLWIATGGVLAGTLVGMRVLQWIPEAAFRRAVGVLLGLLGAAMTVGGVEE